jgi:hypothetical protein
MCPKCGIKKELNAFYKNRSNKDGLGDWCKECTLKADRDWKKANPEKAKAYYRNHIERAKAYSRKILSSSYRKGKSLLSKPHTGATWAFPGKLLGSVHGAICGSDEEKTRGYQNSRLRLSRLRL